MNNEEIIKAFNNRWRIKRDANADVFDYFGGTYETFFRALCRDFFEAGILLNHIDDDELEITSDDFEFWWASYDKKVGKEKCKKLWMKLSKADKKACIEYTPSYVLATSEKCYRKNPETFLRNKCWNDEIIFKDNGNKPAKQDGLEKLADILTT